MIQATITQNTSTRAKGEIVNGKEALEHIARGTAKFIEAEKRTAVTQKVSETR